MSKWRGRFAERGFDGLHDEPRPGKPRAISGLNLVERWFAELTTKPCRLLRAHQ